MRPETCTRRDVLSAAKMYNVHIPDTNMNFLDLSHNEFAFLLLARVLCKSSKCFCYMKYI